ncbi:ras GEF [Exidia glandulosa HHB12029]|uniref:Ras GEF n=1 Tax=Exidia glandulosa HHB12029 TaxID=1314781 RepID=A0A166BL99_EXIGL|nr:ras GEF [Exidia glandulosa HHB12029]
MTHSPSRSVHFATMPRTHAHSRARSQPQCYCPLCVFPSMMLIMGVPHTCSKHTGGDQGSQSAFRNPASPDILRGSVHPWSNDPSSSSSSAHPHRHSREQPSGAMGTPRNSKELTVGVQRRRPSAAQPPAGLNSPTRARSTNDLLAEARRVRENASKEAKLAGVGSPRPSADESSTTTVAEAPEENESSKDDLTEATAGPSREAVNEGLGGPDDSREALGPIEEGRSEPKEPQTIPFLTLDELLDKLLFFAVSGDDSTFIQHFFLTFRRFASPRAVLLGMQKRLRALGGAPSGVLLAKFAQMKICSVLEYWIQNYDTDFATPGAASALRALLKQLVTHIHTAHYGSDLLPFLDAVLELHDRENAWYKPIEDAPLGDDEENDYDDDPGSLLESEEHQPKRQPVGAKDADSNGITASATSSSLALGPPSAGPARERASSFPLQSGNAATPSGPAPTANGSTPSLRPSPGPGPTTVVVPAPSAGLGISHMPRANLKELQRIGQLFQLYDTQHVAEEITRYMLAMFVKIEPRQWLHHVATTKRDPKTDPIREFNVFYNYLSTWVASLILASDKPAKRVKQIERFVELAKLLRMQHNYSGLRCVLNGINMAKIDGDEVSEIFRTRSRAVHKTFMSYCTLLGSSKMHRAYRTALKHTDGPAIPDMEIHTSDLRRAHDSNIDFKEGDASKIHWGKFALMGRLVNGVTLFQSRCRSSVGLNFPERQQLHHQLFSSSLVLMDPNMIEERVGEPPPLAEWDGSIPMGSQMDLPSHDGSGLKPPPMRSAARRLFFW